jgi:inner membrane protein
MDPVTHGLTGALLAETGFARRLGWKATPGMILAAMFPDIDIVYRIGGLPTYIANHRALTHSFVGLVGAGFLLGLIAGRLDEERRYVPWIAALWVALFSHLLLDLITSYGTVVLYPFSKMRFYYDWVFIIDLYLTGMILLFLILSRLKVSRSEMLARTGLLLVVCYIGFCALNHSLAVSRLREAASKNQLSYDAVAAIPQPLSPFVWSGIIDAGTHYYQVLFNDFQTPAPPFEVYNKTTGSFFEEKARESDYGALYYWFARYPVVNERVQANRHIIEFSDLRFYIQVHHFPVRKPFVLRIILDDSGNILQSQFTRS